MRHVTCITSDLALGLTRRHSSSSNEIFPAFMLAKICCSVPSPGGRIRGDGERTRPVTTSSQPSAKPSLMSTAAIEHVPMWAAQRTVRVERVETDE